MSFRLRCIFVHIEADSHRSVCPLINKDDLHMHIGLSTCNTTSQYCIVIIISMESQAIFFSRVGACMSAARFTVIGHRELKCLCIG